MITDLSGASRAEVYRTWCTALGRSLEPLISPIQKKTKQKTTTKTHTGVQLCFSPFVSSGSVLGTFSLPCYKSTRKACCRRSWGGRGNHAWQVLPSAAQPLTPGLTGILFLPLSWGIYFFSSVLRPPSVWRNSEEVGQWVSELLWPRRGRGMIAQEMTWTGTEGLGRGMKTNVYVFNGLNKSV